MPFAEINGIRYHYERSGTGTPLILITGLAGDVNFWNRTLPLLGNYDIVTVDNRGSGITECDCEFTIEDMADDVSSLMDHIGLKKAHVLGWSMGSHIALELAARQPEKVITLTLVSSYLKRPSRSAYILNLMAKELSEGTLSEKSAGEFMNVLLRTERFFSSAEEKNKAVRPAPVGTRNGMLYQMKAVEKYNPMESARRIKIPVLSVHGLEDIMTDSSFGDELASIIGNCKIFRAEKEGHILRPESYVPEVMKFIDSHCD